MIVLDDDGEFVQLEGGGYFKIMRVSALRRILDEIEGDPFVYVNRVGNLSLCTDDYQIFGIIDFNGEEIELFTE